MEGDSPWAAANVLAEDRAMLVAAALLRLGAGFPAPPALPGPGIGEPEHERDRPQAAAGQVCKQPETRGCGRGQEVSQSPKLVSIQRVVSLPIALAASACLSGIRIRRGQSTDGGFLSV
jgi:hypothetical protein